MTQSVSVSYSSSKHQKPQPIGGYAPIQSRQESVGQQHNHYHHNHPQQPKFQGGFNPSTVIVEGGFKPIFPGSGSNILQDRSDQETEGTSDSNEMVTIRYHEKKMGKKLISRKPAAKHVKDDVQKQPQADAMTIESITENVDHENQTIAENNATTEEYKQTAQLIVL